MSRKREVVNGDITLYLFDGKNSQIKELCFNSYFKTEKKISLDYDNYTYYCNPDQSFFSNNDYSLVVDHNKKEEAKRSLIENIEFRLREEVSRKKNWLSVAETNLKIFNKENRVT